MEAARNKQTSLLIWSLVVGFLSQNLLIPVTSTVIDQKNHYLPGHHGRSSPAGGSHRSPSHRHGPSPYDGSGGGSYGSTTPSHGTPSHGGGGGYGGVPPSSNCGNPPSGGGGYYGPNPAPPIHHKSPPITGGGSRQHQSSKHRQVRSL
ncbi:hypothetical protein NMG60_11032724 [Bertholletia excelsa]